MLSLIVWSGGGTVSAFCPSMCQCDDGRLEASCPSARLDSVPILLNPSLRSLNLAGNRIASLRQSVSFYAEVRHSRISLVVRPSSYTHNNKSWVK